MDYSKFLQSVHQQAEKIAGEGGSVMLHHIVKNNGCELDGLVIMKKGSHVAPTIYLNTYYDQYRMGRGMDDIMREIRQIYEKNHHAIAFDPECFSNYERVRTRIVYKVINYEKNKKLLSDIPYKRMLDLAIVFYCLLDQREGMSATALIYHTHLKAWQVTENRIYEDAVTNTPKLLKYCIKPMNKLLNEMVGNDADTEEAMHVSQEEQQDESPWTAMYVLTNKARINGAACILYEDVLDKFAASMSSDLYILPSSIHEVILLPKIACYDKEALTDMVREVNAEGVAVDEILSDHVYEYRRKEGILSM